MVCRACGRIIANEKANFCEYCGTSVDGRDGYGGNDSGQGRGYGSSQAYTSPNYNDPGYNNNGYNNSGYGRDTTGRPGEGNTGIVGVLTGTAGMAEAEASMSFLHWIVILLLPYIPMIGSFAYIILLLVWAFGKTATTTRKNWARASLVVFVVSMIMMAMMMPSLFSMFSGGNVSEVLDSLLGTNPAR